MLFKIFLPLKCQSLPTAADDIYIILADDSSCFFDVCVCGGGGRGGGGGGEGDGVKMSSSKKLAWRFKSSSIHCSHNVHTGDYI